MKEAATTSPVTIRERGILRGGGLRPPIFLSLSFSLFPSCFGKYSYLLYHIILMTIGFGDLDLILKSLICGAYRRCIHKGWCVGRVMSEDNNETCGEGQHDWINKGEDGVHCADCDAEGLDCWIESDEYGEDGYILHVDTHTHQLDDALKAAREAPKAQGIVWDNLEPIDHNLNTGPAPKITTVVPVLKFEIDCDETDTTYQEFEE